MTRHCSTNRRDAFSLIEVILAMAILATSIVLLSQLLGLGLRNARESQGLTEAHMIAETVMESIALGLIPPDPVADQNISMTTDLNTFAVEQDAPWVYSIDWEPAPADGLIMVMVQVRPAEVNAAWQNDSFQLVRWMRDPALALEDIPETSDGAPTESATSVGSAF
ncbi:prepilin-type N-terminal cleavage/methylation domain-containing protein [Blastopirellula marina]|uniref:Prepilin-type cleavage/methylation domain-containing protein n=1 Tax=Blastopirellula marina TaxID=124 RepID=A0A2S8GDE7_9BACT|nr:type II secretion system protein [Blastopirellula marina]PQO42488.1 hypothetical protein C5Y93_29625 [Blastopirellula marina]